ncbi:tubby C-terminal domain-like protein [Metabacillus sp. SLBN-84]
MQLFEYNWRTNYSTKASEIFNENNENIGSIRKKYSNGLVRMLDVFFEGKYFVEYEVLDSKNKLIFNAKANLNPMKRRQYKISYFENGEEYTIHLVDKRMLDIVEKTDFDFDGQNYHIKKVPLEWAKLTVDNQLIAEWHIPLKPPFKGKFKLHDTEYKDRVLLLIGICHTYFNAA